MSEKIIAVLIDDEPKSIKALQWELKTFNREVDIVKTFTNPYEAIEFLQNQRVDCVFLDIEMPEMDGFQFLANFDDREFDVVFVTAYDRFGITAIKHDALDYLLKPIDGQDLISLIKKLKTRTSLRNIGSRKAEEVHPSHSQKRISIPINGKIIFLETEEIICCESDGNYCKLFLEEKKTLFITRKLKEVHSLLPEAKFFRVHNSYVVNLQKVREYLKTDGYVVLSNNQKIPVSRSKRTSFLGKM